MVLAGSDFMTITDETGIVIARGHSDKYGDSVIKQDTVKLALQGQPAAAVVPGTIVPFTIRASQPVIHEGRVVGSLSIGTSLVAPAYLDSLKQMTGANITIFKGDTRVMTTIMQNGERAVGTKLDSPEILDAVLKNGETCFAHNEIFGSQYNSAYWPVKDAHGKPIGMWFVGIPMDVLKALELDAINKTIMVACGLLLILLIVSFIVGHRISSPVGKITNYALGIAEGRTDLKLDVYRKDDMGQLANALRYMEENLRKLVHETAEKAEQARLMGEEAHKAMEAAKQAHAQSESARREGQLAAASQLESAVNIISSASEKLSIQIGQSEQGASEQASRVGETAVAMNEMNSAVLEVARHAASASEVSARTKSKAEEGARIVHDAVAGIQDVHAVSLSLKNDMTKLSDQAQAISTIMGVISDIADQTNLLALNAAIEAARAGDAGRGFAVVADEVRKLAEKTMASTTDVGNAIQSIQRSVEQSIEQMDRAAELIDAATVQSNKSGEALSEIVTMVDETADQVRAIATASEQQSASSEGINRSIGHINGIAEQTVQAMRDASRAVAELAGQSQSLIRLIDEMKRG